ncbi:MAG: tRNA (adenosine(37)-N6)-dimethylallyltransferase MiaA [Bacteroidota bacterium]
MNKTVIVIAGPTAVGKTAVAIQLAQHFQTSIISADSRQCFRELNIGVAKPSPDELDLVPHYFIDSHSILEPVDAAVYEQYALEKLHTIFSSNNIAILTGGTGLYIKALCEGLDQMPAIPPATRQEVRDGFYSFGMEWLQQQVELLDPVYFHSGEIQNPHRLMRALEFVKATGESIKTYQKGKPEHRPFNIVKIGLQLPREILNERINLRVDAMVRDGLVAEARSLIACQHLPALQTVGYREIFDHFNGLSSLDAAIEFIKRNTRQYAKRQMTWFKKDTAFSWFNPGDNAAVVTFAEQEILSKNTSY